MPRQADPLGTARRMADEDLATFRECLAAVQSRLDGAFVSEAVSEHHRAAVAAHRGAEEQVRKAVGANEIASALGLIAAGRWQLAHVEAYVTAEAPPAERPPCLFDPAHGPSVGDATWTTVRYGTRRVPACLHDTALLAAGVPPDGRTIAVDGRTMSYWEAGEALDPYLDGYFPGHAVLAWLRDRGTRLPKGVLAPPPPAYGDIGGFGM